MSQLAQRLGDKNLQDIVNNNGFYHRQCYQNITNKETLKRAKKRFKKAISQATPSASKPKKGRPSRKSDTVTVSTVREKPIIICQKIGGQLHKVETKETSQKMLEVSRDVSAIKFHCVSRRRYSK